MRKLLTLAFIAVSCQAATVIDFQFAGVKETTGMLVSGTGQLSFADGLTEVGLSDLSSFEYTSSEYLRGSTWQPAPIALSDITSFDLTMGENGMPSTASVTTDYASGMAQGYFAMGDTFGSGQATIGAFQDGAAGDLTFSVTYGVPLAAHDVSATAAPEPLSIALCGLGLICAAGWRRFAKP